MVEQGHPYDLILRKGKFYDMVQHSENSENIINKAKRNFENSRKGKYEWDYPIIKINLISSNYI